MSETFSDQYTPERSETLLLRDIDKVVGRDVHLENINLKFESSAINVVLGRTLSGKTSLLRILAGLDRPTRGTILINGQNVTGVSVRKRSVAMVYQQFINYPSLTIYENIASPLKIASVKKSEIDRRVHKTAEMLHIDDLLERLPTELSGGQQQRTAIARALVKEADLLLLDEPLVNLDYKLREELRVELQEIFKQHKSIVVYTTTEPSEALMLEGKIVIIDEGHIIQSGLTQQVYHNPATLKAAEIFSDPPINYIDGMVRENTAWLGHDIEFPLHDHMRSLPSEEYIFGVRSSNLFLSRTGKEDLEIQATVELSEINGSETFIHVDCGYCQMVVQEDGVRSARIGAEIKVYVSPSCFFVYNKEGNLVASPSSGVVQPRQG